MQGAGAADPCGDAHRSSRNRSQDQMAPTATSKKRAQAGAEEDWKKTSPVKDSRAERAYLLRFGMLSQIVPGSWAQARS